MEIKSAIFSCRLPSNGEFIGYALLCYNMLMDDTLIEVEDRTYVNPQKGLDERMQFIDTLRDVQAQNTAQINQNTYNLGSPVTSNVGGLGGSEGLWKAQYQTPQTNAQIADLKAVAQQTALNQALNNLQDQYQNKYKQATRNYARRAKSRRDSGGTTSDVTPLGNVPENAPDPEIETISTDVTSVQQGIAPAGWAYIPNHMGGDRWYKLKEDGTIDYKNYVDKNPASSTTTRVDPNTGEKTTTNNAGTYVMENGQLRKLQ